METKEFLTILLKHKRFIVAKQKHQRNNESKHMEQFSLWMN